jgi:hypothetical protein
MITAQRPGDKGRDTRPAGILPMSNLAARMPPGGAGGSSSNPALSNPALSNPALSNPALSNPALSAGIILRAQKLSQVHSTHLPGVGVPGRLEPTRLKVNITHRDYTWHVR